MFRIFSLIDRMCESNNSGSHRRCFPDDCLLFRDCLLTVSKVKVKIIKTFGWQSAWMNLVCNCQFTLAAHNQSRSSLPLLCLRRSKENIGVLRADEEKPIIPDPRGVDVKKLGSIATCEFLWEQQQCYQRNQPTLTSTQGRTLLFYLPIIPNLHGSFDMTFIDCTELNLKLLISKKLPDKDQALAAGLRSACPRL